MSLTTLLTDLELAHPYTGLSKPTKAVVDWLKTYVAEKNKEFASNRDEGKITFGKYRGQTVEQVAGLDKGLDYLGWVSRQTWMSADKFPALYVKITEALKKV